MPSWNAASERLLMGMVRVCQNFMKLMCDSEKDTLTGLHNRRKLESHLAARLAGASARPARGRPRQGRVRQGRLPGRARPGPVQAHQRHLWPPDRRRSAAHFRQHPAAPPCANDDRSFRYGGEEFIVVLNDVSPEQAASALERLRGNVESHSFPQVGQVTVSIGYTRIDRQDLPTRVIEEADKALYYAKEHGRNQVRNYSALRAAGPWQTAGTTVRSSCSEV